MRRLGVVLLGAAALTAGAVGCGGGSDKPTTVERTKVKVVEPSGGGGNFNAADIFKRYSNGVVTITSLYGKSKSLESVLGGGGTAGQGTGFVLDEHGLIATNAHVITEGMGKKIKKASQVYAQFADGNQVPAKIVGFDPNADVGLVKVDPKGLELVRDWLAWFSKDPHTQRQQRKK